MPPAIPKDSRSWMFLTNHAHVLLAIAADPDRRVEDIAGQAGITTRQALNILRDLEDSGYLQRARTGRRSRYTLSADRPFRHPSIASHNVAELLAIFSDQSKER
jgi:predicted ArsR family transcriptional regulator